MRKYIIAFMILIGIFTFSLFKSEQNINIEKEIETAVFPANTVPVSQNVEIETVTSTVTTFTTMIYTTHTQTVTTVTSIAVTSVTEEPQTVEEIITETQVVEEVPDEQVYEEEIVYEEVAVEESIPEEDFIEETEETTESPEEAPVSQNMTYLGNLKITGYVATGNPTASGDYPYVGGVAMSSSYGLPFNTTIYIDGLGYYTINDTGCSYGVVDVFCGSLDECYGLTSYADVYIVE